MERKRPGPFRAKSYKFDPKSGSKFNPVLLPRFPKNLIGSPITFKNLKGDDPTRIMIPFINNLGVPLWGRNFLIWNTNLLSFFVSLWITVTRRIENTIPNVKTKKITSIFLALIRLTLPVKGFAARCECLLRHKPNRLIPFIRQYFARRPKFGPIVLHYPYLFKVARVPTKYFRGVFPEFVEKISKSDYSFMFYETILKIPFWRNSGIYPPIWRLNEYTMLESERGVPVHYQSSNLGFKIVHWTI